MDLKDLTLSIVTRNRPIPLCRMLTSLMSQGTGWKLDIIDSSEPSVKTERCVNDIRMVLERMGIESRVLEPPEHANTVALQYGAERAETKYVMRHEDDVVLEPNYLPRLLDVLARDWPGLNVLGVGATAPDASCHVQMVPLPDRFVNAVFKAHLDDVGDVLHPYDAQMQWYDCTGKEDRVYPVPHLHGQFMYKREAFLKAGGFNRECSRIGHREETFATLRAYFQGYDWLVVPAVKGWHTCWPSGGSRDGLNDAQRRAMQIGDERAFTKALSGWMVEHPDRFIHVGTPDTFPFEKTYLRVSDGA